MNIQPLRNEGSTVLRKVSKNKKLATKLSEAPMEQKVNKNGMRLGSCAGMVSWSYNTMPMDVFNYSKKEKLQMEGSCAGMVSWSLNQLPQC